MILLFYKRKFYFFYRADRIREINVMKAGATQYARGAHLPRQKVDMRPKNKKKSTKMCI